MTATAITIFFMWGTLSFVCLSANQARF